MIWDAQQMAFPCYESWKTAMQWKPEGELSNCRKHLLWPVCSYTKPSVKQCVCVCVCKL